MCHNVGCRKEGAVPGNVFANPVARAALVGRFADYARSQQQRGIFATQFWPAEQKLEIPRARAPARVPREWTRRAMRE
eukprot:10778381-Lingulodinium_polyedra.AAC.1